MPEKNVAYRRKSVQQRRQELIQAGIDCLGSGGMSAFTIDQICKQAGVSRGLINHHFKTKEDLLIHIYHEMTEHLIVDRSLASPRQQLKAIIDSSFDQLSFNKSSLRAWLSIWGQVPNNRSLSSLHQERYRIYKTNIEKTLDGLADEDGLKIDSDSIARQLIALIDGLWLEYCLHSEGFSLIDAKTDCHRFLRSNGITI